MAIRIEKNELTYYYFTHYTLLYTLHNHYLPASDNLTSRLDLRLGTNAICKGVKQRDGKEGGAREVVTVYGN